MKRVAAFAVVVLMVTAGASAYTVSYTDSVNFTSDLEPSQDIVLPTFDTDIYGLGMLTGVDLYFYHSGSADISADNDDPFQGAEANARIIRTFSASSIPGWGFPVVGTRTEASPPVALLADDGDLSVFDSTAPDGHAFSNLNFADVGAAAAFPAPVSLYESAGSSTVSFPVLPDTMVNDLQWSVTPDSWQMEVENPVYEVEVEVVYTYLPEPMTLSLLAFGGLAALRRRR